MSPKEKQASAQAAYGEQTTLSENLYNLCKMTEKDCK